MINFFDPAILFILVCSYIGSIGTLNKIFIFNQCLWFLSVGAWVLYCVQYFWSELCRFWQSSLLPVGAKEQFVTIPIWH